MSVDKVCAYEECLQSFSAFSDAQRFCSVSCGSKASTVRTPEKIEEYFFAYARVPDNPLDCWIWQGSRNDQGYGMAFVRRTKIRAHRLSYEIHHGVIPDGMDILHSIKCISRACVNPNHLRTGNDTENCADRDVTETTQRGENHYAAKLTEKKVEHILKRHHEDGINLKTLARQYHVSHITIHDIVYRKTWMHVCPGAYPPPTRDGRAVVTADDVRIIRKMRTDGSTYGAIALKFGITTGHVFDICARKSWKHVE